MDEASLAEELNRILATLDYEPSRILGPRVISASRRTNPPRGQSIWVESDGTFGYVKTDDERGGRDERISSDDPYDVLHAVAYRIAHKIASAEAESIWDGSGDYRRILFNRLFPKMEALGTPYLSRYNNYIVRVLSRNPYRD